MPKLTPMLKQYQEIKARYPDALVLYRLGDFYELFERDAEQVAAQLGLVLTKRRFSNQVHLPMCGLPHHRLNSYLKRLIRLGHKVAIVEQLEVARKTKRLVERDVVRVITPGTVVEDQLLQDREQNLLAGIMASSRSPVGYGLAYVDLSTGEFAATQIASTDPEPDFWEELDRIGPAEVLVPNSLADDSALSSRLGVIGAARISPIEDTAFALAAARERLQAHFGVRTLEGFGCDNMPLAVSAAGAILHYLQENQISDLAHIVRLVTYDLGQYVTFDSVTRRNLELERTLREGRRKGTLYESLNQTSTAMGGRLLRRWLTQPLLDLTTLHERQAVVNELVEQPMLLTDLRDALRGVLDVERLVGRIGFGNANARDLVALRQALERVPRISALLSKAESSRLLALNDELDSRTLAELAKLIADAIVDDPPILLREGGLIRRGYEQELEQLRAIASDGRAWIAEFEAQERKRTGIKNLRVRYNQVFGFFVEVTKSNLHLVPQEYERRATVRHAERFATPALKEREMHILEAEDRIKDLEYELFVQLRQRIASESAVLTQAARILAELDTLASLAVAATMNGYVRPTLDEGTDIRIQEGRHPVVERFLADGERFVPNDTNLTREERVLILTGPNMSGKSVYIRQVALIVLLAQIGSFVPAKEAHVGLVDGIFVRAGASDDIAHGRSTFLVEMSEMSFILRHASQQSLVVLDEVGRGTSTYDGVSIAWAVAEELHDRIGARTLFATHFHELTRLVQELEGARNYTLAVTEEGRQVIFLRQLVVGGADKSYGIQVARLAGLPDRVIERAQSVLSGFESQAQTRKESCEIPSSPSATVWAVEENKSSLFRSLDEPTVWATLRELYELDVANLTPVRALLALNDLRSRLVASID